mmetsp:Transcript_58325/g.188888  ORF Transcript_58325/g.188888 Transcript_58325/m.188888 type:complete len:228 (-) Transcript_58325:527-1210(-)
MAVGALVRAKTPLLRKPSPKPFAASHGRTSNQPLEDAAPQLPSSSLPPPRADHVASTWRSSFCSSVVMLSAASSCTWHARAHACRSSRSCCRKSSTWILTSATAAAVDFPGLPPPAECGPPGVRPAEAPRGGGVGSEARQRKRVLLDWHRPVRHSPRRGLPTEVPYDVLYGDNASGRPAPAPNAAAAAAAMGDAVPRRRLTWCLCNSARKAAAMASAAPFSSAKRTL